MALALYEGVLNFDQSIDLTLSYLTTVGVDYVMRTLYTKQNKPEFYTPINVGPCLLKCTVGLVFIVNGALQVLCMYVCMYVCCLFSVQILLNV